MGKICAWGEKPGGEAALLAQSGDRLVIVADVDGGCSKGLDISREPFAPLYPSAAPEWEGLRDV